MNLVNPARSIHRQVHINAPRVRSVSCQLNLPSVHSINLLCKMPFTEEFEGKIVIVTGAARGIGKAMVEALHKIGANVYAISKSPDNLKALKEQCPNIQTVAVDLGNWKETRAAVEGLPAADYLINNAGVCFQETFLTTSEEDLDLTFSVNLKAVVNVSQTFAKKCIEAGKPGSIANISSNVAKIPAPGIFAYSSLKAGLDHMTRNMAAELAPFKIRVNSVNPGPVDTDMLRETMKKIEETYPGMSMEQIISRMPMKMSSVPVDHVVNLTLFLLSNSAGCAIGNTVMVDGGYHVI